MGYGRQIRTDDIADLSRLTSVPHGECYASAAGATTIAVGNTWYDANATWSDGELQDFTHANGYLTYTGSESTQFSISVGFTGTLAGGDRFLYTGVSINGGTPAEALRRVGHQSTILLTIDTGDAIMNLSQGDNVCLKVTTGATRTSTTQAFTRMTIRRLY